MTIRIQTDTGLRCGYRSCNRQPGRPEMTFIVRGRYRLAPGAPVELLRSDEISEDLVARTRLESPEAADDLDEARLTLGQGSLIGDVFEDADEDREGAVVYPSDLVEYKPKADVLLRAVCHPPRATDTACDVTFRVGDWKKTLKIVGPRVWVDRAGGGKHTEPQPVDAMPVDYAHAYGGPGFDENPIGKGHVERVAEETEELYQPPRSLRSQVMPSQQLANVLFADGAHEKGGLPAGFAPLNPTWPFRRRKLGKKYDREWLDTRAPCFAADMDWTHFNAAPPDQQLDGYLRGDEEIAFENLHPARARFSARLPGVRVRVFVRDAEKNAREVAMKLDTLFADLMDGSLYLVWRGVTTVKEEDLTDVEFGLVVTESLTEAQKPVRQYLDALEAFALDPVGMKEAFSAGLKEVGERAEKLEDATDAELEALLSNSDGNSPPVAVIKNLTGPLAPRGLERLDATWTKSMAVEGADEAAARAQIVDGLKKTFRKGPAPADEAPAKEKPAQTTVGLRLPVREGEKPVFPLGNIVRENEKALVEMKNRVPPDAPPETVAKIDAALERMRKNPQLLEVDPHYKPYSEEDPPPDPPGPGADLLGRDLSDQDLGGKDLSGADLQCAILGRTNLAGANLKGAKLGGARLDGAILDGADLGDVDLTSASFDRVSARGAKLERTRLDLFRAQKCDFTDASFAGSEGLLATFSQSTLERADFSGSSSLLLGFDGCELSGAKLGAKLEHARFDGCKAKGAVLTGAELVGTSFNDCDLQEIDASRARGDGAVFYKSRLSRARFERAELKASHFLGVDAADASFARAYLPGARFDRAILRDASFERASLLRADLRKASLTRTTFKKACLRDAQVTQAAGVDVDIEGADTAGMNAQRIAARHDARRNPVTPADALVASVKAGRPMEGAQIGSLDLRGRNLSGAKLRGAVLVGVALDGADLSNADLTDAEIVECSFDQAMLDGASLEGAKIAMSSFADADLRGCTLGRSKLVSCSMPRIRLDGTSLAETALAKCDLSGASLAGARLTRVSLDLSTLADANLKSVHAVESTASKADFTGARLDEAHLVKVLFAGSNLTKAAFDGARLEDVIFATANLTGCRLSRTMFGCIFNGAYVVPPGAAAPADPTAGDLSLDLTGIDLRGTNLSRSVFHRAVLRGADLREANLEGATFRECDLTDARLEGANLFRSILDGAKLPGAQLRGMRLRLGMWMRADLHGADLSGAHVDLTNLQGADLSGANLRGAVIENAILDGARLDGILVERTRFDKVGFEKLDMRGFPFDGLTMTACDFTKCNFAGMRVVGCDFEKSNFTEANLSRVSFERCSVKMATARKTILEGASLRGVSAKGAFFGEASLEGADLRDATMRYATFTRANLTGALFIAADLRDALLDHATAQKTCFQSARMIYADLSHADATSADFSNANLFGAKVHNLKDAKAKYDGAITLMQRTTDVPLLEAEAYNPARSG